ncbi:hypothetical protein ACFW2V_13600 [Streptomyces sp. NPDC058947]|uniref:hypothetical protein n=1 Tax=Streptomyces sp. NPDC058947 TaxID=3346675 RepID=UPI00369A78C3
MIKGNISFTGETIEDVRDAIEEALERINLGNTTGFDNNDSSSFRFDVEHDA